MLQNYPINVCNIIENFSSQAEDRKAKGTPQARDQALRVALSSIGHLVQILSEVSIIFKGGLLILGKMSVKGRICF